jgi:hypothetical protein
VMCSHAVFRHVSVVKGKQLGTALTKMYLLLRSKLKPPTNNKTPYLKNSTQTGLDLRNTTLPVEGSAHDNGRTMVCAEYSNTERSPKPNG